MSTAEQIMREIQKLPEPGCQKGKRERILDYSLSNRHNKDRRTNMDKIKVIHDTVGHTLTVWLDDPSLEHVCEETNEEVILIKDKAGHVIGFEKLHYTPSNSQKRLAVETVVQTGP